MVVEHNDWMVCVRCFTFNHANYIKDALNGFCMQQTNFPFVCCIIDDHSIDGEQAIINDYLEEHFIIHDTPNVRKEENDDYELTFARHKYNKNCFFAVFYLKYNHYSIKKNRLSYIKEWNDNSNYIALCEGDDYWIDAGYLQNQVDFLEKNGKYGMVYSDCNSYVQSTHTLLNANCKTGHTEPRDMLLENYIATLTVIMRASSYEKYLMEVDEKTRSSWKMGDYPIWIWFSIRSKIGYIHKTVATYRILDSSASHNKDLKKQLEFAINAKEISLYFANRYGYEDVLLQLEREINKYYSLRSLLDLDIHNFLFYYRNSSKISKESLWGYFKNGVKLKLFSKR